MRRQNLCRKLGFIVIFCVVIQINCLNFNSGCDGCNNEYTRIKRAKYYNSPPIKFYNRPPYSPPIRGPFSYTPPPGYTASSNDIGPYPLNLRPYKVSKRPTNEGLGDEDINNLFKYLTKKDLDKIVEYAYEKDKYSDRYREPIGSNNYEYSSPDFVNNENLHKDQDNESDKTINSRPGTLYSRPGESRHNFDDNTNIKFFNTQFQEPNKNHQTYPQEPFNSEESKQDGQFSFLDAYIEKEIREMRPEKKNIFTDSTTMQEEQLPNPLNLRNDDYEVSYTSNVASVAKPESSYKVENFADLPLMEYVNSKLHNVDSYNVPHYSVTSPGTQNLKPSFPSQSSSSLSSSSLLSSLLSPSSFGPLVVEPAPPKSVAKEQSDAHLKATKIWTHRSKGTAYTLHDDGTLTLEKPTRPNNKLN